MIDSTVIKLTFRAYETRFLTIYGVHNSSIYNVILKLQFYQNFTFLQLISKFDYKKASSTNQGYVKSTLSFACSHAYFYQPE